LSFSLQIYTYFLDSATSKGLKNVFLAKKFGYVRILLLFCSKLHEIITQKTELL